MIHAYIPLSLQRRVRLRAGERCEYCKLAQAGQEATYHVDHVAPRREGGPTVLENLALACVSCSLRKAAQIDAIDPLTSQRVPLFNPREEPWDDHFQVSGSGEITGRTPAGRATASLLRMNRPLAIAIRLEEVQRKRYP